jgi:hypothetical protein
MRSGAHAVAIMAALFVAMAGIMVGQQSLAPLGARLKVRWQGSTVLFDEDGTLHEVSIKGQFGAAGLDSVKVQSAKQKTGFIYLLLDVTGPSKIPADSHQCGAGAESNLVWLKLDQDWKLLDAKTFLYESCWSTVEAADPPRWEGDTLKVSADKFTANSTETQVASYSYKRPEEGLKISEAVIVKQ